MHTTFVENIKALLWSNFWADIGAKELPQEKNAIDPVSKLSVGFNKLLSFDYEHTNSESRMYSLFSKANSARVEIRLGEMDFDRLIEDLDYLGLNKRAVYEKNGETYISLPYKDVRKSMDINERFAEEIREKLTEKVKEKTDLLDETTVGEMTYTNQLSIDVMGAGRTQIIIIPAVGYHGRKISEALDGLVQEEDITAYRGNPGQHIDTQKLCDALQIRNVSADMPTEMSKRGDFSRNAGD